MAQNTFHVALYVRDLDAAIARYRKLLGQEPAKVRHDYAKFEIADPPVILSLNTGGKPGAPGAPSGSTLEMASRGLEELQASLGGGDADGVEVLEEMQEISAEALARQGEDAPVVRLVNVVLMSAIQKGASDIHIEPYEKELRVRYRIDGILYNIMAPPMKYRDAIVSRVKIMSKLDIA